MYQTSISPDRVLTSIIAWPRKSSDSRVSFCRSLLFRSLSSSQTRIFIRSVELLHSLKLENTIWNFCLFSRIITFKIILFICKCFARSGILAKSRTKHYGQEFRLLFQIGQSIPNRQNSGLSTTYINYFDTYNENFSSHSGFRSWWIVRVLLRTFQF